MQGCCSRRGLGPRWLALVLLANAAVAGRVFSGPVTESAPLDIRGWNDVFAFCHDYEVVETAGLPRSCEPIEVTLSVPASPARCWPDHIRVVRLESSQRGRVVPHQVLGSASANAPAQRDGAGPAPAQSVNVVFLARCAARSAATYRLFWGLPSGGDTTGRALPTANLTNPLRLSGTAPALAISNEFYAIELDLKSGAISTVRRANQPASAAMLYHRKTVPIHFGTDIWSPPQGWDHDYDWTAPPNQRWDGGPIVARYHRWGPLQSYRDVLSSISYTFYAHVPYVHVSALLELTADRSVRAIRMGEIVVAHSRTGHSSEQDAREPIEDVFSHYAWPTEAGGIERRAIDRHRGPDGMANCAGVAAGGLGILARDVPWVAGYHAAKGYGMASLRKSQFVGNRLGGPTPHSAPCTYIANYGWGFTYWSRPMVYPLGMKQTAEDQNLAVAAGTIFATEEALLVFEPDETLSPVQTEYRRFVQPLQLQFKGTGPW